MGEGCANLEQVAWVVEAAIDGIGETVRGGGHKSPRLGRPEAHRLNIYPASKFGQVA